MKKVALLALFAVSMLAFPSGAIRAEKRPHPTRDEFRQAMLARQTSYAWAAPGSAQILNPGPEALPRPAFAGFKSSGAGGAGESVVVPESLCDEKSYWQGGESWTSDSNGTAYVWGAGGNFYFAAASDPTHPVEMWWGDVPLRVRLHNNRAYFFCYFYTYVFDVTEPVSPAFIYYGPGYINGYMDAYPSPDDDFLIITDYWSGDLWVWNLETMEVTWNVNNPNFGWYVDMHIVDEKNVAIVGDWNNGSFDFYDISDLSCKAPVLIGQINDSSANTGLVFYKYPFLYGNWETWQFYNRWLIAAQPDNECHVSVYHLPDASQPANSMLVKNFEGAYDIVSMKDPGGDGVAVAYYQNRIARYDAQLSSLLNAGYFAPSLYSHNNGVALYDFGIDPAGGVVSSCERGSRFFDPALSEICHFSTGGYARGVLAKGNYLYVPSGYAGLAILDNTDPTYPVTYSFIEPGAYFSMIMYAAVSEDGNFCYVSDGTANVWVVDITNKLAPVVRSTAHPYVAGGDVTCLTVAGSSLVVGTVNSIETVNVSAPSYPTMIYQQPIPAGVRNITPFPHPSYPDRNFLGAVSPTTFYAYRSDNGVLSDAGSLSVFTGLTDVTITGTFAYVISNTNAVIYPISMSSASPFDPFELSTSGTTPLSIGWSHAPDYCYVERISDTLLAASGNSVTTGYHAIFLVNIGSNPAAPSLLPPGQQGMVPFDWLTGLTSLNGIVYYATDYFGTGALNLVADYDIPVVTAGYPAVSPFIPDISWWGLNPTGGWLQKTVQLTAKVRDDSSAITKVVFKYYDGGAWRTISTLTNSTPAGVEGTYTYSWDTTKWTYGQGVGAIRVEVTDSGCNTTIANSAYTYAINLPPSFELSWDAGCNEPPVGAGCGPAGPWIVCGDLCLWIQGTAEALNEVYNPGDPMDDVSQIAYKIDNGAWVLIDIPMDGPNPYHCCIDTTALTDGPHTLYVRITDDCTLQTTKDINGESSWAFTVHNDGPSMYITAPLTGGSVSGSAVHVAAAAAGELPARPVSQVRFYLDPSDLNDPVTGTLIGTATLKDINGEFSITWDSSGTPYGNHIMMAAAWEDSDCCYGPYKSPLVIFSVISPGALPSEIAAGSSEIDTQSWSADKTTQSWPFETNSTGYRLYRGTLSQLAGLADGTLDSCVRYEGAGASVDLSADDPSGETGRLYWYLVTGSNGSLEGTAGYSSQHVERSADATGNCAP